MNRSVSWLNSRYGCPINARCSRSVSPQYGSPETRPYPESNPWADSDVPGRLCPSGNFCDRFPADLRPVQAACGGAQAQNMHSNISMGILGNPNPATRPFSNRGRAEKNGCPIQGGGKYPRFSLCRNNRSRCRQDFSEGGKLGADDLCQQKTGSITKPCFARIQI